MSSHTPAFILKAPLILFIFLCLKYQVQKQHILRFRQRHRFWTLTALTRYYVFYCKTELSPVSKPSSKCKKRTEIDLWGSLVCGASSSVGFSNCHGIVQLAYPARHKQYHVTTSFRIYRCFICFTSDSTLDCLFGAKTVL